MTVRDEFGEVDPDEVDDLDGSDRGTGRATSGVGPRRGRRRWWVAAGAVGVLAAGAGTWVALDGDGGRQRAGTVPGGDAVAFEGGAGTAEEPALTSRLVIGEPPAEMVIVSALDADDTFFGGPEIVSSLLIGTPGATASSGRWISLTAAEYDEDWLEDATGAPDVITVDGRNVVLDEFGDGLHVTLPIDQRWNVDVTTYGLTVDQLRRLAESFTMDRDGTFVFRDRAVVDGMEVITAGGATALWTGAVGADASLVSYATVDGARMLELQTMVATADSWRLLRFMTDGPVDVEVHGLPAIAGRAADVFADRSIVAWVEGGRTILVHGEEPVDQLVAIAESVRPASDEEWEAALAAQWPDDGGGLDGDDQWVIAAGDLADRSTWVIEASVDDGFEWCVQRTSAGMCASEAGAIGPDHPVLLVSGDVDGATAVLAMVDRSIAGAVLRVTVGEREPQVVPLREIDASFPGPAAALAVGSTSASATAEVVAADGAVLATLAL